MINHFKYMKCPICGQMAPRKADICPHCHYKLIKKPPLYKRNWFIGIIVIIICISMIATLF